jgi:hypothetical protein
MVVLSRNCARHRKFAKNKRKTKHKIVKLKNIDRRHGVLLDAETHLNMYFVQESFYAAPKIYQICSLPTSKTACVCDVSAIVNETVVSRAAQNCFETKVKLIASSVHTEEQEEKRVKLTLHPLSNKLFFMLDQDAFVQVTSDFTCTWYTPHTM